MNSKYFKHLAVSVLATVGSMAVNAAIITSTNASDFNLTAVAFPNTAFTTNNIVSTDGSVTLDTTTGVGNPATTNATYSGFSPLLPGSEYAISGDENFDILFSTLQTAFAMNYADEDTDSIFTLNFFNGATTVGSTQFTSTAPFKTAKFIGFASDMAFDKVTVREDDRGTNSNEYFQFYKATAVPESHRAADQ